jgi:hypothetical protein
VIAIAGIALVAAAATADSRWFEDHWLSSYCTRSPVTPVLEGSARLLAAGSGVGLLTFARSALTEGVSRIGVGELLRKSAPVALALALALLFSDGVLRLTHRDRMLTDDARLPARSIGPAGNFALLASQTREVTVGNRVIRYAIDAAGNRAASSDHVIDPDAPTILFTGESIGMGWGVAYENTYWALVANALGIQAVNVSVTGFANDQAYLRAKDALAKLSRPIAVVTVALADQLERDVHPTRERLVLSSEGRLELAPASTSWWQTSPLRKLLGYHSSEAVPLARAIFRATADLARSREARPLFIWTNYGRPCSTTDRGTSLLEERIFSGLDAIHVRVDIAPDQTIEKGKDAHPNEIGHQALAKAVLDALAPKASP